MKYFLFTIILFSLSYSSTFELELDSNGELLKSLYSNLNWDIIETTNDSIIVSQKEIKESSLKAIKVEKIVNIPPELFADVIMNVGNYNSFLTNAESFKSKVIDVTPTDVIGYQHITVDFPFVDNREYYFYMSTNSPDIKFNDLISFWTLLDPEINKNLIKINKNSVYLKEGAGLWRWEQSAKSDSYKISYMLSMHPGGALPDFLIELINQSSIVTLFRDVINKTIANMNDRQ